MRKLCIKLGQLTAYLLLLLFYHGSAMKREDFNMTLTPFYFQQQRLNASFEMIRFGDSYSVEKSPSHQLEDLKSSVAILIIIDNWTKQTFSPTKTEIVCGMFTESRRKSPCIAPLTSEMIIFENGGGLSGVCGVLSWSSKDEENTHIHIMWSIPYNLNSYDAYVGAGISSEVNFSKETSSIFKEIYYGSEESGDFFHRAKAGNVVEYSTPSLQIRAYIQAKNYKPIMSVSIIPTTIEDDKTEELGISFDNTLEPTTISSKSPYLTTSIEDEFLLSYNTSENWLADPLISSIHNHSSMNKPLVHTFGTFLSFLILIKFIH